MEIIASDREVGARVRAEVDKASDEVLAFAGKPAVEETCPGDAEADRETQLRALERGVRVRSLLRHSTRFHLPSIGLMETLTRAGGEFRTIGEVVQPSWVIDRRLCLVRIAPQVPEAEGNGIDGGAARGTAVVFHHRAVVDYFASLFQSAWDRGVRFDPDRVQEPEVSDRTKASILLLLATGVKDEVIAQRLGMSVRSCRRHIASLMASLGTGSRFQAGAEAQRRGLLG